ncbi:MAG TPA: Plug domain-containing protein [Gemmatimonadaceae bacterium]|nr:Plug domain-containing protein [Gemmatimonadaceae bacterium]
MSRPVGAAKARADTIKTPTARAYTPRSTELGSNRWHWDRDQLFASGALTLGELLAFIPGVTLLSTGFILAPQVAAWYGDVGHLRIYVDGIEIDPIAVRNGGVSDLAMQPMWALEDVVAERSAGELRVHLRTYRVERTTPMTRTDVLTGSENTNLYRGYFGKRQGNGAVFQFAGQQFSTVSRGGLDGDALGAMVRLGWAAGRWDIDATLLRQGATRNSGARFLTTNPQLNAMPPLNGSESVAYLRVAWGDPETDGPWAQAIASALSASTTHSTSGQSGAAPPISSGTIAADSVDTTTVRSQYVLAAGMTRWGLRLSTTERIRSIRGKAYISPGLRAEFDTRLLTLSAFGEQGVDSTTRADLLARVSPVSWFSLSGSVSRAAPKSAALGPPATASRLEAGLRWRDRWFTGGMVRRSASRLAAPVELDTALRAINAPATTGTTFSLRGPLALGWALDLDVVNWGAPGPYRPQTQAHSRLLFESSFPGKFPRGNFHVLAAGMYDYRSMISVPLGTNPLGQSAAAAGVYSTLLEIRIGSAVISWQNRNIAGLPYETFPGYLMPRLTNIYGLRWNFWN